jgi:hypothetical protein
MTNIDEKKQPGEEREGAAALVPKYKDTKIISILNIFNRVLNDPDTPAPTQQAIADEAGAAQEHVSFVGLNFLSPWERHALMRARETTRIQDEIEKIFKANGKLPGNVDLAVMLKTTHKRIAYAKRQLKDKGKIPDVTPEPLSARIRREVDDCLERKFGPWPDEIARAIFGDQVTKRQRHTVQETMRRLDKDKKEKIIELRKER